MSLMSLLRIRTIPAPLEGFHILAALIRSHGDQHPGFYRSLIARSVLNGAVTELEGRDLLALLRDVGAPLGNGHDEAAFPQ